MKTTAYGTCHYCQREALDCTEGPAGPVCAACGWVRRIPEKVYGRNVSQPDRCKVVVELCHPNAQMPRQASPGDACYDLFLCEPVTMQNGETHVLPLGFKLQLEPGWEAQIRGRSSMQSKGFLFNFGTIDEGYRKELSLIVTCLLPVTQSYHGKPGERIAQMAVRRVPVVELLAGVVEPTERGGFGSTGR